MEAKGLLFKTFTGAAAPAPTAPAPPAPRLRLPLLRRPGFGSGSHRVTPEHPVWPIRALEHPDAAHRFPPDGTCAPAGLNNALHTRHPLQHLTEELGTAAQA